MKTQRAGFTLVELLVVSVVGALTLAAVYETLIVQEQSYRASSAMISGQDALRTAMGIMESELREVAAVDEGEAGGSDIRMATSDSITFRAQRKIAFVCSTSKSEKWMLTWAMGDLMAPGDSLLLFVDGDSIRNTDDRWETAYVASATNASDTNCSNRWPGMPLQKIQLSAHDLTGVTLGSPVRSFQWVTYGIYKFGHLGWGLGRRSGEGPPRYLVGNLASPQLNGFHLRYFDNTDTPTGNPWEINRIEVWVRSDPRGAPNTDPTVLHTNLYLRNN